MSGVSPDPGVKHGLVLSHRGDLQHLLTALSVRSLTETATVHIAEYITQLQQCTSHLSNQSLQASNVKRTNACIWITHNNWQIYSATV